MSNPCSDCLQTTLGIGLQGPVGPQGNAGVDGNSGAAGADGANILNNPTTEISTALAVAPQNLRTFVVTPAMLANVGDEITVSGYVSSFDMFPGGSIVLTFGGAPLFSWNGIAGNPLIAQEYYFEATIRKNGAASEFFEGKGESGVLNSVSWLQKRATGAAVVDLTVNQNLVLTVDSGTGVFQAGEMIS